MLWIMKNYKILCSLLPMKQDCIQDPGNKRTQLLAIQRFGKVWRGISFPEPRSSRGASGRHSPPAKVRAVKVPLTFQRSGIAHFRSGISDSWARATIVYCAAKVERHY